MKSTVINWLFISALILSIQTIGKSQISGFVKTGINVGFINKEKWFSLSYPVEFDYGQPLIRPVFSYGLEYKVEKVNFRFSLLYQTKGQGSKIPRVRNFFQSTSPDKIHFMSFPLGVEYKLWPKLSIGAAIQPSLFLGGTDNYWASEYWKGWIWSSVLSVHYFIQKEIEIGFDYDYDFTYYYCDGCDHRFFTYRTYVAYHFIKSKHKNN